jgi:hypothetical protein
MASIHLHLLSDCAHQSQCVTNNALEVARNSSWVEILTVLYGSGQSLALNRKVSLERYSVERKCLKMLDIGEHY